MKIFKIIIFTLLTLFIVILVGVFIAIKTVDVNNYKTQISKKISDQLHREVEIGKIGFNISSLKGLLLQLDDVVIYENESDKQAMFSVDKVDLDVNLLTFLTEHTITVTKIALNKPLIHIVKNADGKFNFEDVLEEDGSLEDKQEQKSGKEVDSHRSDDISDLLIKTIMISDASIKYTDHSTETVREVVVDQLDLNINAFSLQKPFQYTLNCRVLSLTRNIKFAGIMLIDLRSGQLRMDDINLKFYLNDLVFDQLNSIVPEFKQLGLKEPMTGEVRLKMDQIVIGELGVVLSMNIEVVDARLEFEDFDEPIENIDLQVEFTETDINIKSLFLYFAGGKITGTQRVNDVLTNPKVIFDINIDDISLSELLKNQELPVKIEGAVGGIVKGTMSELGQQPVLNHMTAESELKIKNGVIKDVNLLKDILGKISFIPNLVSKIMENLPKKYQDQLKAKDTILRSAEMEVNVKDGFIIIDRLLVDANGFGLRGSGRISAQNILFAKGTLFIEKDLSQSIITSAEDMKFLLNQNGEIEIPLKSYEGELDKYKPYPDVEDLFQKALKTKGKEELQNVIQKALGLENQSQPSTPENQDGENSTPNQPQPETIIIENILDSIFGK